MEISKAIEAIKFTCTHCGSAQYSDDTLSEETHENNPVRSDVIDCADCGKENKVIMDR